MRLASSQRIAITGLGMVSALGVGARPGFARLCAGESGLRPLTLFDSSALQGHLAAEVRDLPSMPADFDRTDFLAWLAAREALSEAKWAPSAPGLGLALGGTTAGMFETENELEGAGASAALGRARRLLTHPLSSVERRLSATLGPFACAVSVCSACSSGAAAIVLGAHWLASGKAQAVLAGGADGLCRMTFAGFSALGLVDPEPCRPFDVRRRGLTLGEGAGFLLLELESSARERAAPVLGWLSGWALGAEAHHVTQPEASGTRAARLMLEAIERAGLGIDDIDYVNAHGTGTPANDAMEAAALSRVFGVRGDGVRISSSKAQLGHTLGAAGAIEAVITSLSLEAGAAPPSLGLEQPEVSALRYVGSRAEACPLRAALSNSFGFGGLDAVLLFEAPSAARRRLPAARQGSLVVSSAALVGPRLAVGRACLDELTGVPTAPPLAPDPFESLDAGRSRRFDRATGLATQAAEAALVAARLPAAEVGLVLGSAYGAVERSLRFLDRLIQRGLRAALPAEFPHLVASAAAGNLSLYLGVTGPALAVSASGLSAEASLATAAALVELGLCGSALAGAIEAHDSVVQSLAPAFLSAEAAPRSEGGGFIVVERDAVAAARGLRPLARIVAVEEHRSGLRPQSLALGPPLDESRALLVLAQGADAILARLGASPWTRVRRQRVLEHRGYFEAVGLHAIALGALLVAEGVPDLLVLTAEADVLFAVRLSAIESP